MGSDGEWVHADVQLADVALHYVECGAGPPVVLLHGFPEFWYSWRRQLDCLADAGFRAIAVDLRGYNQSSCPSGVQHYRMNTLVGDIAGLIERLAIGPAAIVGHDWGGVIAWRLAAQRPELLRRLIILNAPHPAAFRRELHRNPVQWLRSWYAMFFQTPTLPERLLRMRNFAAIRTMLRGTAASADAFTDEDLNRYADAFRQPGRLTAALDYYRAALRFHSDLNQPPHAVAAPTLVIWGDRDPALSKRLSQGLEAWAPGVEVTHLPNASHWVHHDEPELVSQLITDFLRRDSFALKSWRLPPDEP